MVSGGMGNTEIAKEGSEVEKITELSMLPEPKCLSAFILFVLLIQFMDSSDVV